jgi:hypothetical protein
MAWFLVQTEEIMLSFESLLVPGILAFYLYDSIILLSSNELVFTRHHPAWEFGCPGDSHLLFGRRLYIPNPLTPGIPLFRVYWLESGQRPKNDASLEKFLATISPLRYMMVVLLSIFFVGIPAVLIYFGSSKQLLWAFGSIYIVILATLILIFAKKDALGISNRQFLALSFESMACAPFALNLLRKLTLHRSINSDPIEFAREMFRRETFYRLLDAVCERIDEQIEFTEPGGQQLTRLQSYKTRLSSMKQ